MALTATNKYCAGHFKAAFSITSLSDSGGASYFTIGSTRNGFDLKWTFHEQVVQDDAFGDGAADTIQQGADLEVTGVLISTALFTAANNSPFWNQTGAEGQSNNNVGLRGSDLYGTLVLTPIAGTPAAALLGGGNSYIFYLACIINDLSIPLSSKLREIPVTFRCLPDPVLTNLFYVIASTPGGVPAT